MAGYNPTFKIRLLDVLEDAYPDEELRESLRPFISDVEFKQIYGQRVVDRIVERTRDENVDKNNRPLGSYSKTYKESLIFSIYKAGQTSVDLTLTGEMLESLTHKPSRYEITVFLDGQNNRDKAQGHITGRYGTKGRSKPRDFLGVPKDELRELFRDSMKEFRGSSVLEREVLRAA